MSEIECLTWNVHRCRGQDSRIDPDRTAEVLLDLIGDAPPDLLVLTEADAEQPPYAGLLDLGRIERETGLRHAQSDSALRWGDSSHGFLGTVVLHGPALRANGGSLLDLPGHYPRGASVLTFDHATGPLRLVATHLSLTQALRAVQMRSIGQHLERSAQMPTLLVGDLNEWRPWNGLALSRGLVGQTFRGPAPASFPSYWPALPLDRILATAPARVLGATAISTPAVRRTSDHLPVRGRVALG